MRTSPVPSSAFRPRSLRLPSLGRRAAFALHASVLVGLLAASSAPTPLYSGYQAQWRFSALTLTIVFSTYALALLGALLVAGTLSDHLGRRPRHPGCGHRSGDRRDRRAGAGGAGVANRPRPGPSGNSSLHPSPERNPQ